MIEGTYTQPQRAVLRSFYGALRNIMEVERLRAVAFRCPVIGVGEAIDQAVADLSLDNFPSYDVLEARLRGAIVVARSEGLGDHQDIRKAAKLSGLDEGTMTT